MFLGLWRGIVEQRDRIRLFRRDGTLVPIPEEVAEAERQWADAAEAELSRLRARLAERNQG